MAVERTLVVDAARVVEREAAVEREAEVAAVRAAVAAQRACIARSGIVHGVSVCNPYRNAVARRPRRREGGKEARGRQRRPRGAR